MLRDDIKNIKSSTKDLTKFGITVGIALVIPGCILLFLKRENYPYFLFCGLVFILSGLVIPRILKPIQKIWLTMAVIIGWFMTRVILSILFYFVLTPIGLILRIFGKKFLELKYEKSQQSYWNYREAKEFKKIDYERQF